MRGFRRFGEPLATFGKSNFSGIVYQLLDRFNTARSAGAINGTTAEPSGQTRTVVDSNSKLTIANGVLTFATGGAAGGDPGLWYSALTTVLGRVVICEVTPGSTSQGGAFGVFSAQSGVVPTNGYRLIGTNVLGILTGGSGISVATFTILVTYKLCLIQRAAGFFYFVRGGTEFPNWTLIYLTITGAVGTWYPGIEATGTSTIFTADNIRVPVTLYIPPPLAFDGFSRSNGALGSSENVGQDGQVIVGLAWQFTVSVWTISTNKAIATPVPGSEVIVNGGFGADTDWTKGSGWAIASGTANATTASTNLTQTVAPLTAHRFYLVVYTLSAFAAGTVQAVIGGTSMPTHAANATYTEIGLATTTAFLFTGAGFSGSLDNVSAKVLAWADIFATLLCSTADILMDVAVTIVGATSGLPAGLVCNLDSPSNPQNFVLVYLDGNGNCVIAEMVAGSITVKQTTAITYSAGAILRVARRGTECRAFYNNAAVGSAQTMTVNTNKYHGMFDPTASNSLDNVAIWASGTSNEYGTLDNFYD